MKPALSRETAITISVITFIGCLAYGLMIPWLGLYWDEIGNMWIAHAQGADGLRASMAIDRPVLGIIWALQYQVIGENILLWHILALVARIASGLTVVWLFHELWHKKRFPAFAAGLLYTVYPGFLQQPIGFLYQLTFITMALSNLSLAAMLRAHKMGRGQSVWLWTGIALLTQGFQILFLEYFLGLELLRVILLWFISGQQSPASLRQRFVITIKRWIPYLLVAVIFLFWRVFVFDAGRNATDVETAIFGQFQDNFLASLLQLPVEFLHGFLNAAVFSWVVPAYQSLTASTTLLLAATGLLIFSLVVTGIYGLMLQRHNDTSEIKSDGYNRRWASHCLLIGLVAAPGSLLFVLLTGRNALLLSHFDRYTLPMLLPVTMIVIGCVYLVVKTSFRAWFVAGLASIAVATHFTNANIYRNEWLRTKDMWWQIAWRIPQLQPNSTLLIEDAHGLIIRQDYTVWGLANMVYRADAANPDVYGAFLDAAVVEAVQNQLNVEVRDWRRVRLNRNFRNPLVIVRQDRGCLRIIDSERQELPQAGTQQLFAVAQYSDVSSIVTDTQPVTPPSHMFGPEPDHGWCYYFQKGDLARQTGNYEAAIALREEALQNALAPADVSEWLPFIESFVALNRHDEAAELMAAILDADAQLSEAICSMLARYNLPPEYDQLGCPITEV